MIDRSLDPTRIPFIPAKWKTEVKPGRHVQLLVLHSMEAPEKGTTAESVARYFQRGERQASAHYCVDSDSIVQSVQTKDVAWAAPNANRNGVHIELAGYARQSRQDWMDEFSTATLHNAAYLCGMVLCPKFQIPPVFLNSEALKRTKENTALKGFTTHLAITEAFNTGGHTDPGKGFPMDVFLSWVRKILAGETI